MKKIIDLKKFIIEHLVNEGDSVFDEDTGREVEVVDMTVGKYLLRENGEFVEVVDTMQQVFVFFGLNR